MKKIYPSPKDSICTSKDSLVVESNLRSLALKEMRRVYKTPGVRRILKTLKFLIEHGEE